MNPRVVSLSSLAFFLALGAATSAAQSLADIARQEQAKHAQEGQKSGKVYTTDDLTEHPLAAVPSTYSLTQLNATIDSHITMTVHVYRDGPRELVEISYPPQKDDPKGYDTRKLFDTQAHKVYSWDVVNSDRPCSADDYTSASLPSQNDPGAPDPLPAAAAVNANLARENTKDVGKDTVNGIATKVVEVSDPASGGKNRFWLDEKQNAVIRWVTIDKDGKARALVEVKDLNFDSPPPTLLIPPAACTAAAAQKTQKPS